MIGIRELLKYKRIRYLAVALLAALILGGTWLLGPLTLKPPISPGEETSSSPLMLQAYPSRYSPTMSRVPGLRIMAIYGGKADKVRYGTDHGQLLTWDSTSGRIKEWGTQVDLPYATPVYWSPLGAGSTAEITVAVSVWQGDRLLAESILTLQPKMELYWVTPSPQVFISDIPPTSFPSLEEAVISSILFQGKAFYPGETATQGHIILDTEETDGVIMVYTVASFSWFGFENGIFTTVSGSGAIPTVISLFKNEQGEYTLLEYQEPVDGAGNTESIKKIFPKKLWDKVLKANDYYPDLAQQKEEQAKAYLRTICREAIVTSDHVEKILAKIDVTAANQLLSMKNLVGFPYWLGTREQIENGARYIYEKSLGKTEDGYDLITYQKKREDGSVLQEYKYKIIGSELQLLP